MVIDNRTVLLDETDSFESGRLMGCRLFCVLVPMSRKKEFQTSDLAKVLMHCTDRIIFYVGE